MYKISTSKRFEKNLLTCAKRGYNMTLIRTAMEILARDGKLPKEYKPHKLSGQFDKCWECHIQPDWLMVWQQNNNTLTLMFLQTGTHSDIF